MRFLALLSLTACSPDLPTGWEDARPVDDLVQSECGGSPYDSDTPEPVVVAEAAAGALTVSAEPVTFRCAQAVEGFWRADGDAISVLVQPIDMTPKAVAGCDCLYRVEATLPAPDAASVTVWQRWDAINDPNDPVEVGAAPVGP